MSKKPEKTIKVNIEDIDLLMTKCKELYLNAHPEMKNVFISRKFMFNKVVKFYLEN